VCWRLWYHDDPADQPGISPQELARIRAEAAPSVHSRAPWGELFRQRQLWLIIAMYFCYAWGSWFYFGWFSVYLVKGAGFTEAEMGLFSALPFLFGAAGNLIGGFLSDRLVARYGLKTGRRVVGSVSLIVSALLLIGMTFTKNHAAVVILSSLGFGIADLMLPSAWAICLDIGRNHAGVVTGAMNTAGQLGGFVCSVLFGYMVKATNNYQQPLWIVAGMVLIAALLFTRIDATRPLLAESPVTTQAL
jgi:predicted MFS family arabinose efflux permease